MVGHNENFKKVFVTNTAALYAGAGSTEALPDGQMGFFRGDTYAATAAPAYATMKTLLLAQGTPDYSGMPGGAGTRNETNKTFIFNARDIVGWRGKKAAAGQAPIVAVGYDGVDEEKSITGKCDEIKHLYIKLTGKPIENLIPGGYVLHLQAQGPCCDNCADNNCEDVDPNIFADEFLARFNEHTILGGLPLTKFVTAEKLTGVNTAGDPVAGLKFTSSFVERPASVINYGIFPHNADPVHIEISEWNPDWHGERCTSTYPVTQLQEAAYPMGHPGYVMELEEKWKMWDGIYFSEDLARRNAYGQKLYTDPANTYDEYVLTLRRNYNVGGWSDRYEDTYEVFVFFPTGQGTAFQSAVNTYIAAAGLPLAAVVL